MAISSIDAFDAVVEYGWKGQFSVSAPRLGYASSRDGTSWISNANSGSTSAMWFLIPVNRGSSVEHVAAMRWQDVARSS
jgi:hypothetical protein